MGITGFFYENAAKTPERRNLAVVRQGDEQAAFPVRLYKPGAQGIEEKVALGGGAELEEAGVINNAGHILAGGLFPGVA